MVNNFRTRNNKGEKHPRSKVTLEQVQEIRRLAELGVSRKAIEERFGMSKSAIASIIMRKTWTEE